jgi:hypothetical protein
LTESFQNLDITDAWPLADILLINDAERIERLFRANQLATPHICWRPDLAALCVDELRYLGQTWSALRQGDDPPCADSIDLSEVEAACDYAMALDVLMKGEDFHYQLYGQRIASVTGFDMTGKLLSSVPTKSALAAFFLASYRAVVLSKSPLLTIHEPPAYAIQWTRLILPLVDADGAVTRLLAGNIPHDRTPRFNAPMR